MRPNPLVLVLLATACASGGGSSSTAVTPNVTTNTGRIVTTGGDAIQINAMNIDTDVRLFSTGTPDQVWAVLPQVYAELGIPLTVNVSRTKALGNAGVRVRRSIAKVPLYQYFDCGSSGTMQNAETYRITMSIMTTAQPNPGGGTVVSTALSGTGKNPITSSSAEVRCASMGNLEIRIRDMVQKKTEGM